MGCIFIFGFILVVGTASFLIRKGAPEKPPSSAPQTGTQRGESDVALDYEDKTEDAVFENPGFGNHWIKLKLVGTTSNRAAIDLKVNR